MKKRILLVLLCTLFAVSCIGLIACNPKEDNKLYGGFEWDIYEGTDVRPGGNSETVLEEDPVQQQSSPTLALHYWRKRANDYKNWAFWLWSDAVDGSEHLLQYQDSFGAVTYVALSALGVTETGRVGLIPKQKAPASGEDPWVKDLNDDRWLDLSQLEKDSNNVLHVYIAQGDIGLYKDLDEMNHGVSAAFDYSDRIAIEAKSDIGAINMYENDKLLAQIADFEGTTTRKVYYTFVSEHPASVTSSYEVEVEFTDSYKLRTSVNALLLCTQPEFEEAYYYDGDDLGATLEANSTTFKVWSPVSQRIVLNLYESGNGGAAYETHEMTMGEKGVWQYTVNQRTDGKYYTYTVYNASYPSGAEIVDPYAKSAGLNGKRGMVVDFDSNRAKPEDWDAISPIPYDANELTVWETHVADVTSSATWTGTESNRHKFLGMIESGTTYAKNGVSVKTGFDHIVELGVNAVQLVPIFDQANDESNMSFNWGYNPLNYNVLEGGYSSDASDGYVRIKEFRQLVQAFNKEGINIIMDVVYNHVSAAAGSNFDVLCPGYFYRYTSGGKLSNGSGCGNETASDHLMFRKFMIDSVCFWAKTYNLGGFRFDLMGLHDIETMNQLVAALREINPDIIVYGEPWTGGTTTLSGSKQATQQNANKFEGYAQFNDQMRDALIKGGLSSSTEQGWASGSYLTDNIINGLQGFTGSNVRDLYKTVNYVTCHDNYTLKDRMIATGKMSTQYKQGAMFANSVVFTSNGITFMLAGEEFLRSKGDLATNDPNDRKDEAIHNSYTSSYTMNSLNYELKVDNKDMFDNYCKLIAFKQMFVKEFKLNSNAAVAANYRVEKLQAADGLQITIQAGNKTWKVIHSGPQGNAVVDLSGYTLYLDTLGTATLSSNTALGSYQTLIVYKQQ